MVPDWSLQVRHSSTLLELVWPGIGIAVWLTTAIPTGNDTWVVVRTQPDPVVNRGIGGVPPGRALPPSARAFYELLVGECKERPTAAGRTGFGLAVFGCRKSGDDMLD